MLKELVQMADRIWVHVACLQPSLVPFLIKSSAQSSGSASSLSEEEVGRERVVIAR